MMLLMVAVMVVLAWCPHLSTRVRSSHGTPRVSNPSSGSLYDHHSHQLMH
jgi:hypothetical protein